MVPRQGSAAPFNDWNERIARECYIPNAYARINDSMGRVVEMVNNYEYLNFNFGPTLLSWLENRYPVCYARIIRTAAETRFKRGHSNAIAQAYNHQIMPLASFNDRLTQVLWGLADFERRFGFRAEAMWLPETAADENTLRLLIDQGLRYAILSPGQAERIRPAGSQKWTDASSGVFETRRPYVWFDRGPDGAPLRERSLILFFYDGPISKAMAFDGALKNSENFAAMITAGFETGAAHDQLLTLAVDGETFGHHSKFADMTLAHAFRHEIKKRGIEVTNLSCYLDSHPAQYEAEIKKGPDGDGTAWSCAHGIRRWKGGCDCGTENGGQALWRAPLRTALNLLRDEADKEYRDRAGALLKDIWSARNEYVSVFSAPAGVRTEAFLAKHAARPLSTEEKVLALKLLELQKDVAFSFTSCGWFFSDISRIEPAQNLKYAARAAAALRELGRDTEKDLLSLLELAPSNYREFGNGRGVYESLSRTARHTPESLAAFRLIERFLLEPERSPARAGRPAKVKYALPDIKPGIRGGMETAAGLLTSEDALTLETSAFAFLYARKDSGLPLIWLAPREERPALERLANETNLPAMRAGAAALKAIEISFADFPEEDRAAIIRDFIRSVRRKSHAHLLGIMRDYLGALDSVQASVSQEFSDLRQEIEIYAAEVIEALFDEISVSGSHEGLATIFAQAGTLRRHGLKARFPAPPRGADDCVLAALDETLPAPSTENLERLLKLLEAVRYLDLGDAFFHLQNGLSDLFAEVKAAPARWKPFASVLKELYAESGIIIERFSLELDALEQR